MSTSSRSYEEAYESGLITEKQFEVITFFHLADGPVCQGEVVGNFNDLRNSYQPRFRELEKAGVIVRSGTKENPATGRKVKAYVLSGLVPDKRVEPISTKKMVTCPCCGHTFE